MIKEKELHHLMQKVKNNKNVVCEEFLKIGKYLIEKGLPKKALEIVKIAISKYPDSLQIVKLESQILIELGFHNAALKRLIYLNKSLPQDAEVIILLGITYLKLGLVSDAVGIFDFIAQNSPKDKQQHILNHISKIFSKNGRSDLALKYIEKAYGINPNNPKILRNYAYLLRENRQYEEAKIIYNKYLKYNPFSKNVWFELAQTEFNNRNYTKAIEALDYALAIDPTDDSLISSKFYFMRLLKGLKEAIKDLKKNLKYNPYASYSLHILGTWYMQKGKFLKALKIFKSGLKTEKNPFILADLGLIAHRLGYKKIAYYAYYQAIKDIDELPEYWLRLSRLLAEDNKQQLAIKAYKITVSLSPQKENWLEFIDYLLALKFTRKALQVAKLAYNTFQHSQFDFSYKIACIYEQLGNLVDAALYYKRARNYDPEKFKEKMQNKADKN